MIDLDHSRTIFMRQPQEPKLLAVEAHKQNGSIGFIDSLRGVAVLCVVAFHSFGVAFGRDALDWSGDLRDFSSASRTFLLFLPLAFGSFGVAAFFVISGFCIHISFERSSGSWIDYGSRRFFRIYPPYVFSLIVILAGGFAFNTFPTSRDVVSHLFMVHNLDKSTFFSINPSFWSIATEVQLYMVYPLFHLAASRLGWSRTCTSCLAIEIALRIARGMSDSLVPFCIAESPLAYSGSWTLGAWAADQYVRGVVPKKNNAAILILAIMLVAFYFYRPLAPLSFTTAAALTVVALRNNLGKARQHTLNSAIFLSYVGCMSYSIYLFHQPALRTLGQILTTYMPTIHPVFVLLSCGLALIPILVFSDLSYRLIELRSASLHKRFSLFIKRKTLLTP